MQHITDVVCGGIGVKSTTLPVVSKYSTCYIYVQYIILGNKYRDTAYVFTIPHFVEFL